MNKSTPISQLPAQTSAGSTAFVNDQQRQMITQAQNAIQQSVLPQNTQISNDVINEDDAAIQDMLNNLSSQQEHTMPVSYNQSANAQEELMRLAAMNNLNIHQLNSLMNNYGPQNSAPAQAAPAPVGFASGLAYLLASEVRLAGIVFIAVLAVQFVPFGRFVGKYVAIDKIPYSDVLLRAIIASLIVVVVAALFKR